MTIIGVDPGSHSLGLFILNQGRITHRTIRAEGEYQERLRAVYSGLHDAFLAIDGPAQVYIEEGVYRSRGRSIALTLSMLAEVRGLIMACAWAHGWEVRRIGVQTWKAKLSVAERKMKKGGIYTLHFNRSRGWSCSTPDEVDAALIAGCAY